LTRWAVTFVHQLGIPAPQPDRPPCCAMSHQGRAPATRPDHPAAALTLRSSPPDAPRPGLIEGAASERRAARRRTSPEPSSPAGAPAMFRPGKDGSATSRAGARVSSRCRRARKTFSLELCRPRRGPGSQPLRRSAPRSQSTAAECAWSLASSGSNSAIVAANTAAVSLPDCARETCANKPPALPDRRHGQLVSFQMPTQLRLHQSRR